MDILAQPWRLQPNAVTSACLCSVYDLKGQGPIQECSSMNCVVHVCVQCVCVCMSVKEGLPSICATSSRTSSSFQASLARASKAVRTMSASDELSSSCLIHTSSCIHAPSSKTRPHHPPGRPVDSVYEVMLSENYRILSRFFHELLECFDLCLVGFLLILYLKQWVTCMGITHIYLLVLMCGQICVSAVTHWSQTQQWLSTAPCLNQHLHQPG